MLPCWCPKAFRVDDQCYVAHLAHYELWYETHLPSIYHEAPTSFRWIRHISKVLIVPEEPRMTQLDSTQTSASAHKCFLVPVYVFQFVAKQWIGPQIRTLIRGTEAAAVMFHKHRAGCLRSQCW